jgi:uncharacterized protein YecT (DUF1311 family)
MQRGGAGETTQMARDYVAEIEALKGRGGQHHSVVPYEVAALGRAWQAPVETDMRKGDLFIIRLVTMLEVATRTWITALVDHGDPFFSNAEELFKRYSLKIDFKTARAITGKRISLGDLIAHTISTNGIGDIDKALTAILGTDLKPALATAIDPIMKLIGPWEDILVPNPNATYATIQRLFECRHVLIHEMPSKPPYQDGEVENFISHVLGFTKAVDAIVGQAMGHTALTQAEINEEAAESAEATDERLKAVLEALDPRSEDNELQTAQTAWEQYRREHAVYISGINQPLPGSIAPLLYSGAYEQVTQQRIELLEAKLKEQIELTGE